MSEVEQKVKAAVAEQLGLNADDIKTDASFMDDLGADSLDLVELVMSFENEFGITIPDEDSAQLTTVQSAINYVQSKTEAGNQRTASPTSGADRSGKRGITRHGHDPL